MLRTTICLTLSAITLAGCVQTRSPETGEQKLKQLLQPRAYFGDVITQDIKDATGDPNITVIDRRWQWGEIYSCNYAYLRGGGQGRALVCD